MSRKQNGSKRIKPLTVHRTARGFCNRIFGFRVRLLLRNLQFLPGMDGVGGKAVQRLDFLVPRAVAELLLGDGPKRVALASYRAAIVSMTVS
jgi:hypothetical protein